MKSILAVVGALAVGVIPAFGDVVVSADLPLEYTDAALDAAHAKVTLSDGAVIRVTDGGATPQPGFVAKRETVSGVLQLADMQTLRDPQLGTVSTDGDPTNLAFDVAERTEHGKAVWNHFARWQVPASGDYVFFSAFDDMAGILIDGRPMLFPAQGSTFTASTNVFLEAGWHTLEVLLYNSWSLFGKLDGYSLGLGWAQASTPLTAETCNTANRFADAGDGTSLRQINNGVFCRRLDIPAGTATLDMTASGLVGPFAVGGANAGLQTGPDATLVVKGATNLVFNGRGNNDGVHYPLFDARVAFKDAAAAAVDGSVHIYGEVSLKRIFPNYVIDKSAKIAYWGTNMIDGAVWTLEHADAQLISTAAIAPTTRVEVAEGRMLTLKPCQHHSTTYWTWQGIPGVFSNDFTLAGANATLRTRAYKDLELTGAIRGNGTLSQVDNCTQGPLVLSGDLSGFGGTLLTSVGGRIQVNAAAAGNGNERIVLGTAGETETSSFCFKPAGVPETATTARAPTVVGATEAAYLEALPNQVVTIGRFEGVGGLKTANLTDSRIIVESFAPGATPVLRWTANVLLQNAGTNVTVRALGWPGHTSRLELAPDAGPLATLDIGDRATTEFVGTGTILRVTGTGTLLVRGEVCLLNVASTVNVRTVAGGVVRDTDAVKLDDVLGDLPALWLDASKPSTYEQYLNCVYTNGIVIRRWNDCRPTQTALYGLNPRGDGYARVYPYVMTNALNGLNVVSMGAVGHSLPLEYGHVDVPSGTPVTSDTGDQPETRRMPFSQPIRFRTAIIVFNSAHGGGGAILGGYSTGTCNDLRGDEKNTFEAKSTACLLYRGKTEKASLQNPSTPIFNKERATWLDGAAVDPTKTGYNGAWQIVSFCSETPEGEDVRSIGMMESFTNPGGMDYAEVLIYTNTLTDVERSVVERYLARKWGVSVFDAPLPILGKGQVEVADTLEAAGSFAGTANVLAGARLDLSRRPAAPTEMDVPAEGRVGWFDPDAADDLVTDSTYDEEGTGIYALFNRGQPQETGTYYLHGTYNPENGPAGDRRPRAARSARGDGPVRTWMNFYEDSPDGSGNTLRLKDDPSLIRRTAENAGSFYGNVVCDTRTAFIVSDSCYGGGNPIADDVRINGQIKRRVVNDAGSPIWAKNTAFSVTNGETRLNGVVVDGGEWGFTGVPEVFSFTTASNFPAAFFGSCGVDHGERSYEVLGEILLYNRVVEGAERDLIEAYLMNKWLGTLPGGWCDWRRATITGAGTVAAASVETLPMFDAAFTGTLELAAASLGFHVDAEGVVTDALTLPENATLDLPASGAVTVSFAEKPTSCTLATAGAITGFDLEQWTVTTQPVSSGSCRLSCTDGVLRLEVIPAGLSIIIR